MPNVRAFAAVQFCDNQFDVLYAAMTTAKGAVRAGADMESLM